MSWAEWVPAAALLALNALSISTWRRLCARSLVSATLDALIGRGPKPNSPEQSVMALVCAQVFLVACTALLAWGIGNEDRCLWTIAVGVPIGLVSIILLGKGFTFGSATDTGSA